MKTLYQAIEAKGIKTLSVYAHLFPMKWAQELFPLQNKMEVNGRQYQGDSILLSLSGDIKLEIKRDPEEILLTKGELSSLIDFKELGHRRWVSKKWIKGVGWLTLTYQ